MNAQDDPLPGVRPYVPDPHLDDIEEQPASEYLRPALIRGLRRFDPSARTDTYADIRLFGNVFRGGFFDRHAADIFIRVQEEIDAAVGDDDRAAVQLGFRSVGKGSVILHIRPTAPIPRSKNDLFPVTEPSMVERALKIVLDLHDALEDGRTEELAQSKKALATRIRQLVESLDAVDAGIELDIADSDGKRRQSRLTAEGRAVARAYFERKTQETTVVVAGALRTISTSGHIEILVGRRVVNVENVPVGTAEALKSDFNSYVRVRARRIAKVAPAGKASKVEYLFEGIVSHEEVVPESDFAHF